MSSTPLFDAPWTTPFGMPPFDRIGAEAFAPAFARALAAHKAEIAAIAGSSEAPTFQNTIAAMEGAGRMLDRVASVFFNLAGADTNEALQAIERDISPVLARHGDEIVMNAPLFARIEALFDRRQSLGLGSEELRVLELTRRNFVQAGAKLSADAKQRMAAINERLATLTTQFSQNVLADEKDFLLVIDDEAGLDGLPDFVRASMAQAAADRGHPGKHAVTLGRSIIEPFLTFSARRDLREQAFKAWSARGDRGGPTDNKAIIAEIVRLRAEKAKLLGFQSFAAWKLDDTMARTPEAVRELLTAVWPRARAKAGRERDDLMALARSEGQNDDIAPWDWRYYAEKVRKAKYDLDEAELKPYLQLDRVIEAAFDTANRLFGLRFERLTDLPVYHPDVRAYEVMDREGRHVGVFLGDYFGRPSKRSGAWMSAYRGQDKLPGGGRPIIVNVMGFSKPPEGKPALLSFDDARTLFHEFGHALHGLLSDVTYPSISGTSVYRDFVELPSQLYEHWLEQPAVLERFARHAETGQPMPKALIERLRAARTFNQGFQTVEYTSSALYDLDAHVLTDATGFDADAFERQVLGAIGMPREITMRHRPTHFQHVFAGDGYSAGYYSYLWSEVLDADAFRAFTEAGDIFDPATAERLHRFIYSAGGSRDPADLYTAFRGRMPTIDAMLEKRGLDDKAA
jgi:peptidyl-dipeptidase Dcp